MEEGHQKRWTIGRRSFLKATTIWLAKSAFVDKGKGDGREMTLENDFVHLVIDANGRSIGFVDKRTSKNYCASEPLQPFAVIRKQGKSYEPSQCSFANGRLTFEFPQVNITVVIKATAKKRYFVFEVESVSDERIDELVFCSLRVKMAKHVNWTSGIVSDGEFTCCLRVQDFRVGFNLTGGGFPSLSAVCFPKYQISGAKAVLVGCPFDRLRSVLKEVVISEGMLSSPVGGPFALDAEETRGSYGFAVVSEANVDEWIGLCKKAGIALIHMIGWDSSFGHYQPHKNLFPNGLEGLKEVVGKIHAAGLMAGLHVHFGISPHDPFVTPVPDKRLKKDAIFTLAESVDEKATFIPTTEPPKGLDVIWAYASRGNVVQIGDELIQYTALSQDPPGFADCRRGALGTKSSNHNKGEPVEHLYCRYTVFFPDENSSLVDEIAENVARVVNTCGIDMIYMDGAEGMPGGWYGVSKMRAAIFSPLKGRVMVEASDWDYHSWTFHSRIGAWDHPNWGLKKFVDIHCKANEEYRTGSLLPAQLGWWAILGPSENTYAELPDEVEYLCCKALAYDMPMSFQGIELGEPRNARQDEYLELIGRYERLRLARHFPEEVKEKLKAEGEEFLLVQIADGEWAFVPTDYLKHKITGLGDGSEVWTVRNRFAAQLLRLRIQALEVASPYESPDGRIIVDFRESLWIAECAAGVNCSLMPSTEQVKIGEVSGCYRARNGGKERRGTWTKVTKTFSPPLDLRQFGALGVWIYGDGKGEVLNFQLTNPPQYWGTFDEHYVIVDFNGWRYFELHFKERDAERHSDYIWPYGDIYAIYRNPLIRHAVSGLTIYYNNLPPNEEVQCYISPIKALPVTKGKLVNPTVSVNGKRLVFPLALESGQYLEFFSPSDCRLYDERGKFIQKVLPRGEVPEVLAGYNTVSFTCERLEGYSVRAEVTVILEGEPIK